MGTKEKEWWKVKSIQYVKFLPPVINSLATHRKSVSSSRRGSVRIGSPRNASALASVFAHKALTLRNTRNEHAEEVFEKSKKLLQTCNIPVIDCSFNLPRVNAQLERLMGSNVVHLTDRKYMTELRRRITEDFESMLMKRIHQRKADEIQRQRVLLMDGKLHSVPKELRNHPVLIMNESTNNFVIKRRAKLKTERERVSERMIRLGKKWEAEHIVWEEQEKQNEARMKIKEMELLSSDKSYMEKLETVESRKALEKCFRKGEMNMVDFLAKETALMLNRLKSKEKKFVPFTKDLRVVDARRRMSEATIQQLKLIASKVRNSDGSTFDGEASDDADHTEETSQMDSDNTMPTSAKSKKSKGREILSFFTMKFMRNNKKKVSQEGNSARSKSPETITDSVDETFDNVRTDVYVDPVVIKLKSAKNVKELYHVAEKIVGTNIENVLDKSKSADAEEAT